MKLWRPRLNECVEGFTLTREEWRQISDALYLHDGRDAGVSYRATSIWRRMISASSSLRNSTLRHSTAERLNAPAGIGNRWASDNLLAKTQYQGVELIKGWTNKDPERLGSLK